MINHQTAQSQLRSKLSFNERIRMEAILGDLLDVLHDVDPEVAEDHGVVTVLGAFPPYTDQMPVLADWRMLMKRDDYVVSVRISDLITLARLAAIKLEEEA